MDPCSAWTAKANKRVQFGYGLNYLIDIEYAVIVDVEATPARTYDEVAATKTMIKRADERLGLKPERLAADTAYETGKFLHWVIASGLTPHIPVWDMSKREEGILSRADFTFDRQRNLYICPQAKFSQDDWDGARWQDHHLSCEHRRLRLMSAQVQVHSEHELPKDPTRRA